MAPAVQKEFSHGNHADTQRRVEESAAQFRDKSMVHDTKHTTGAAPTVEGEHVHHHVHETVQPVIHKETITPEVVHTTVPIHEVHHAGAEHHGTSVLPTKHIGDFTSGGGTLSGGQKTDGYYEGCPRPYNESMQLGRDGTGIGTTTSTTTSGPHASNMANRADPRVDSDRDGRRHLGERRDSSSSDSSREGVGRGKTTSGVSAIDRGTDPSLTGVTEKSQPRMQDGHRKTIGASGMDDFTSKY